MAQIAKVRGALPRVKCPAELDGSCGGRTVAAHPIAGAVGRGKIADHKAVPHALILCGGSGQTVTLPRASMLQLTTDDVPRQASRPPVAPLSLFEVQE
ncbi:hypothetical protein ACF064_01490 [Streptomyces sp. NPDC015492]|uniref:hypothetical protein n=1 Tax=Streptomyces sp. NPDC015492 TaxID=3364958 RepID=UPI0036FA1C15